MPPPAGESEQLADELNAPEPLLLQLTVPVGAEAPPGLLAVASLTLAVHVVVPFTGTEDGVQLTLVVLDRLMVRVSLPLDETYRESPP